MDYKISYHGGHSGDLCLHADGTKAQSLQSYLSAGFTDVAITEHLPSRSGYLYPEEESLGAEELLSRFTHYMISARNELRTEYGSRFHELWFGFETELYGADRVEYLRSAISYFKPELLVASVHHVRDIPIDYSPELFENIVQICGGMEETFCEYYDAQLELINCLAPYTASIPVVVGHFDLIKVFSKDYFPSSVVQDRMRRNILRAAEVEMVFEVNSRGLKKVGVPYPSTWILNEIRKAGGSITFGDDSHSPDDVGSGYDEICAYIRPYFESISCFKRVFGGYQQVQVSYG